MFGGADLVCSPCLRLQQANKFSAIGAAETVLAIASEARDAYCSSGRGYLVDHRCRLEAAPGCSLQLRVWFCGERRVRALLISCDCTNGTRQRGCLAVPTDAQKFQGIA